MKKKIYLQPDVEDIGMLPFQLMDASRGWSRDASPPTPVEMEGSVNENDNCLLPQHGMNMAVSSTWTNPLFRNRYECEGLKNNAASMCCAWRLYCNKAYNLL